LGLSLNAEQSRQLFIGLNGPYDWKRYVAEFCDAEKLIIAGDRDNAYRLLLFNADQDEWNDLHEAGSAPNMTRILRNLGMSDVQAQLASADVITAVWWADAMAAYAKALANGKSLKAAGEQVVKDANNGYNEPWMVLAAWNLTGKLTNIHAAFANALPQAADAAHP
jgi:hypothetical protein